MNTDLTWNHLREAEGVDGFENFNPCNQIYLKQAKRWATGDHVGEIILYDDIKTGALEIEDAEPIVAMSTNKAGDRIYISQDNKVDLYSYHNGTIKREKECAIRSTLPIHRLHADPVSENLFSCSMEPDIKIYSSKSGKEWAIGTNGVGIRTFSVSNQTEYLAAVDMNGVIKIYTLISEKQLSNDRKVLTGHELSATFSDILPKCLSRDLKAGCEISWHPIQDQLALPSINGSIVLLSKNDEENLKDWKEEFLVTTTSKIGHSASADLNIVAYSPDGLHLLSADNLGTIVIWNLATKNPMKAFVTMTSSFLYNVHWHPEDYLMILSTTSYMKLNKISTQLKVATVESSDSIHTASTETTKLTNKLEVDELNIDSLNQNSITDSTSKSKKSATGRLQKSSGHNLMKSVAAAEEEDDQDLFNDDMSMQVSIEEVKRQVMGVHHPSAITASASGNKETVTEDIPDDMDEDIEDNLVETQDVLSQLQHVGLSLQKLQPPFQPSSTPYDDKKRRYLVWNTIGSIQTREEAISNRIEIRFSDTSRTSNKTEAFPDNYNFKIASLCYEGAVFANDPEEPENEEDVKPGSTVYYHAFPGQRILQGANDSFTYSLPSGEAALAVAVGTGWVAVATSKKYLRLFTSTGIQLPMIWLKGPIVSLTGSGNRLAIFYHSTAITSIEGSEITVDILELSSSKMQWLFLCSSRVPITSKEILKWVGWSSDSDYVLISDSAGVLSALMRYGGWNWIPVLEVAAVRKSIDHIYWPVGVKRGKLLYVLLNGENKPATNPIPIVSTRAFSLPIIEHIKDSKVTTLNQQVVWESLKAEHALAVIQNDPDDSPMNLERMQQRVDEFEVEADKAIIHALVEALKLRKDALAIDLSQRIRKIVGCEKAIIVANNIGRPQVAHVIEKRMKLLIQLQSTDYESIETTNHVVTPAARQKTSNNLDHRNQQQKPQLEEESHRDMQGNNEYGDEEHQETYDRSEQSQESPSLIKSVLGNENIYPNAADGRKSSQNRAMNNSITTSEKQAVSVPKKNPFLKAGPASPELKRKSFEDSLQHLAQGSPSPKRLALSRGNNGTLKEMKPSKIQSRIFM